MPLLSFIIIIILIERLDLEAHERIACEVDNGGYVLIVEYVVDGEVIVLEILPSYLGNSWTLS